MELRNWELGQEAWLKHCILMVEPYLVTSGHGRASLKLPAVLLGRKRNALAGVLSILLLPRQER